MYGRFVSNSNTPICFCWRILRKLAAMVPEPKYFITSPIVTEDDFTGDLGNLDSLQIHDEPSYTLSPVSFVRLPQFENAKEFDITWPFILLHDLDDVRVKFICHQVIVTTYKNEPSLEEKSLTKSI